MSNKPTTTENKLTKTKSKKIVTDVRRLKFLELYLTPGTEYFNNAYQSALKAGYAEASAKKILSRDFQWLEEGLKAVYGSSVDTQALAEKSRMVLNKSLDSEDSYLAQNTAKFVASRVDPEFAQKQEIKIELPKPILGDVVEVEPTVKLEIGNGVSGDNSAE